MSAALTIWIDADACPGMIKEVVFRAANRLKVPVILVANKPIHTPRSAFISSLVVAKGPDVADALIVDRVAQQDLVITADIPLADLIVKKGATALNPRGELYTEENVREKLSIRNFMTEMRGSGLVGGGPPPLNERDKQVFAGAFDRILTKKMRT